MKKILMVLLALALFGCSSSPSDPAPLDPLSARLADFHYEKTDEPDGDWVLTDEKNRYVFDDGWKLLSWSDDDHSVEYSYSDSGIELKIADLKSGSVEEIGYDQ